MSLSATIKSIQDIMRKDVGVDGDAQRIGQLVWMFFLKIYDDKETEHELLDDHYKSPIPEALRWRNWAADPEGMTGDELLDFVNNQLFPTLKNLQPAGNDQRGFVIRGVFEDAYNYMKSGHLMRQVINKIVESIDFNKAQDRHLFGDLYEQILRDLQNAGNAGEYYTPRPVTQFMVDMCAPKLGEKIMDPACGTGGFLTCAIESVRKNDVKTVEQEQTLQESIFGVEKKPLPHLLCTTNMILHGIDVPTNVRHDNTLSRPLRDYGPRDRVDVIVTNPPFGGMEEDGIENNFPANFRTRETADLFLVLIMHLLKDGGRAAVVLPDGTLFGEGIKTRIKEQLLETCNLHTIVRLPNGVFNPYTGIKTNLLFFTKGTPTTETWFYEHPYPAGYKSYSKTKPMRIEEFAAEKAWWNNRVENEYAWKVSADEIKTRNYNLDIKNPHSPDQISHDPVELLANYAQLQKQITNVLNELISNFGGSKGQTIFEHIPLIASAQDGIQNLRSLILELAVRGKILEDDGKQEFKQTKLGLIGKWAVGSGFPTAEQGISGEEILFAKVSDMNLPENIRFISTTNNSISRDTASRLRANIHPAGTVIFPKIGGAIATNKRRILIRDTAIDNNCLGLTPKPGVTSSWLFVLLSSINFTRYQAGTSVPALAQGVLSEIPVSLPPESEQHRIVAKVDTLMLICDQLETLLKASSEAQLIISKTLIQSLLKAA